MGDYFTPADQSTLNDLDLDFGVGGVLLLPDQPGSPHLLITADKTGTLFLLNRDNMGGYQNGPGGSNNDVGQASISPNPSLKNNLAYFNGSVYVAGNGNPLQAYAISISNGTLGTSPTSQSGNTFGTDSSDHDPNGQGANPIISANGTSNGIVWALDNSGYSSSSPAVLYAYNAANLSQELYNSTQAANSRDQAGAAVKFSAPVVANGLVYVPGESSVTVYGLITASKPAAPNNLAAAAGNNQVALSWAASSGATSYNVYRGPASGQEALLHSLVSGTSYTDTNVTNGTTYFYEVTAVNSVGESGKSNEASATPAVTAGTPVNLGGSFNLIGIVSDGSTFSSTGGLDGGGAALSANLLGTSVSAGGNTFTIGAAGSKNVVTAAGQTIVLPSGNYASLKFLATAVSGNQANQKFTVTYTNGTTKTFTQSISDWFTPQNYAGESKAVTMPYRDNYDGTKDSRTFYVYLYSFTLDPTKTIKSIKLPNQGNVKILAIDLVS